MLKDMEANGETEDKIDPVSLYSLQLLTQYLKKNKLTGSKAL
jgi:hypothetical protein